MEIISVTNQKGGCGKTTTAVNLAHALAKRGQRVLLLDLDPQAHTTFSLGLNPELTAADLFERLLSNSPVNLNDFVVSRLDNLFVLGSSMGLSAVEQTLAQQNKLDILKGVLSDAKFDYAIIDCPPNLGALTLTAMMAANYTIVPIGICELSLKGAENLTQIKNMLFEHRQKVLSVFYLITQLDRRLRFSESFLEKVRPQLGKSLLATMIRTNIHLREATAQGKTIYEYKSDARGAHDYQQLAEEISQAAQQKTLIQLYLKGKAYSEVYLTGEFNAWQKDPRHRLSKLSADTWGITLPFKKGTYRYKFIADDNWINDPENPLEESDAFGGKNSILFVR